jgi:hypothetical protein
LKLGDASLPWFFNFAVEYAIRNANQEGLQLNNTHHLLVYAVDVNIVGTDTEALVITSKGIALEVNAKVTKNMGMSQDKNARQSHNIKIGNKSFEGVEQFKYFITTKILFRKKLRAG